MTRMMKKYSLKFFALAILLTMSAACSGPNNVAPVASLSGPAKIHVEDQASFDCIGSTDSDGLINRCSFDFGDGTPVVEGVRRTSHAYAVAGTYAVTLTVRDSGGATATDALRITVVANNLPIAVLQGPDRGGTGTPLTFTGSDSRDDDGRVVTLVYDFGDGVTVGGTGLQTVIHSYNNAGTYTVSLMVFDDRGDHDQVSHQVEIVDPPANLPPVAILAGPSEGTVDQAVALDGSLSYDPDGTVSNYLYDFGDGTTSAGSGLAQVSHAYLSAGIFTVRLTVTDDGGLLTNTVTRQIAISTIASQNVPPVACFQGAAPVRVDRAIGLDATCTSASGVKMATYRWDYGDGSPLGTARAVSHIYTSAGTYNVALKVVATYADASTAYNTMTAQIVVTANIAPVASLASPSAALVGQAVALDGSLSYDSDGTIVNDVYDYGDGTTAGGAGLLQSSHSYAAAGVYTIQLTVTDDGGLTHTVSRQIAISTVASQNVPPVACFTGPSTLLSNQVATFDATCSVAVNATMTYQFNYGDTSPVGNSRVVTHTYTSTGNYVVSLTVVATYADASTAWNSSTAALSVTDLTVAISTVNPSSGGLAGGDLLTVKGIGFTQTVGTTVTLGGIAVGSLTVVDTNTITFTVPAGIVGSADLVISNANGSTTLPAAYTYNGGSNRAAVSYCPVDATAGSSLGFAAGDVDTIKTTTLPFDLPFFNQVLATGSSVYVATNGYVSFTDTQAKFANATIPSASNPADLVAVFFDDLNIGTGQVYTLTTGSTPNRIWTIEWKNVVDNATQSEKLDFAVSFYEGSGDILMQYNNPSTNGTSSSAQSATIGLQKDATTGVLYSFNSVVPGLAPGGKAIRFAFQNGSYLVSDRATLSASVLSPVTDGLLVRGNPFQIQFSNPLNGLTVTAGTTVKLDNLTAPGAVALNVALSGNKSVLQGYPTAQLTFGDRYKVTVTGVADIFGQRLSSDPALFACGATGVSPAFTTTFIAGPQSMSFSAQIAGGGAPMGVASYLDKNGADTVLVVKDSGRLYTYDSADLNNTVGGANVGNGYEEVAVYRFSTGATAVVADSGARTVDIFDVWTRTSPNLLTSLNPAAGGSKPRGVAIYGSKVFVAEDGNESIIVIDLQTQNEIDTDPNSGGTQPVYVPQGCKPRRVAAVGNWIYATCDGSNNLIRINPTTYTMNVMLLPNGTRTLGVVGSPDGKTLYVGDRNNDAIRVWDVTSNTLRSTITGLTGGVQQENLAITADGIYLFVADSNNGEIAVIDTATAQMVDRYTGLNSPDGITVLSGGYQAVAGDNGSNVLVRVH